MHLAQRVLVLGGVTALVGQDEDEGEGLVILAGRDASALSFGGDRVLGGQPGR
uniref:Uncharacterized protein n=1 Tax=Streptomyces sp. NBC_00003 TaxID=2903608 RepID=A0AAU2V0I2_9ACTN